MSAHPGRLAGVGLSLILAAAGPTAWAGARTDQTRLTPDDVTSRAKGDAGAGTSGVAGIQTTVLFGDPSAAGPYTVALRVPAHTIIAPHTHRDDRSAVVISGTWWFGYGPVNAPDQVKALPPGSFYTEPGGQAHFARTGDEPTVVYITGFGPTDTHYLDPAADPRKR
jgi:quercetin dioxygenase-like cupin family protein